MKLSACIIAYNHEKFIAEAMESVLGQVVDFEYEIVIGEDRSSDSTRQIVSSYQAKYPDIIRVLYHEENLGMMENYSHTIQQCRGEYIALMDGDDYWINNFKLKKQVDFLDANQEYALCFHDAKILKPNGLWDSRTCCGPDLKTRIFFEDVICDVHIPTASIVFRRRALEGFPPRWFGELRAPDRPICLLVSSTGPAYYFNEPWSVYRKHPKGIWTGQHYLSQWLTHLEIYKVINNHYKHKYNGAFCRCEGEVSYALATSLIRDNDVKTAWSYFRTYIRRNQLFPIKWSIYHKVLHFAVLFLKSKLGLFKKHHRPSDA